MKKRVIAGFVIASAVLFSAGCGNAIPEMTQEQQALVVEYAAGTVLKHDKHYKGKLVELTLEENTGEESETADITGEEAEPNPRQEEGMAAEHQAEQAGAVSDATIDSFLQLDGVQIRYDGYEVCSSYPSEEGDGSELYFMMNATEGNQLLVLKFQAENISGTETEVNLSERNARFRVQVNGESKNALTTMLPNDLAYYKGMLAAGESTQMVLVCEVAEDVSHAISSLSLTIRTADDSATISLEE